MNWELVGLLFKEHGRYLTAIAILAWWGWQERKENRTRSKDQIAADREDSKTMITVLVEVRDALKSFKEVIDRKLPRID